MKSLIPRLLSAAVAGTITISAAVSCAQRPVRTDDASLAEQIDRKIHSDVDLAAFDVRAEVNHGTATLSGTVATDAQKERARQLAQTTGVSQVDNRIAVNATPLTPAPSNNDSVAAKARESFEQSASAIEKAADKAGETTKQGLKTAGREVTDGWILSLVKSRFFGEKALQGSHINVDVDRHVVTLKGTVGSENARTRAIDIASNTEGVAHVIDRLTVSTGN